MINIDNELRRTRRARRLWNVLRTVAFYGTVGSLIRLAYLLVMAEPGSRIQGVQAAVSLALLTATFFLNRKATDAEQQYVLARRLAYAVARNLPCPVCKATGDERCDSGLHS